MDECIEQEVKEMNLDENKGLLDAIVLELERYKRDNEFIPCNRLMSEEDKQYAQWRRWLAS